MHPRHPTPAPGPTAPGYGPTADRSSPGSGVPPVVDTARLFGGRDELTLLHRGAEYRLRITRFGRLILTK